jgi:predicted GNAT family N-acyltransferase
LRLEREAPAQTADLMRRLAETAEERTSYNLTSTNALSASRERSVSIHLCRNKEMLEAAQRLRYEVYCQELHRNSPFADHQKKTITDDLDGFGHTFVAMEGNEIIGTMRVNFSSEGPLGMLEELYGMKTSVHHPSATAISTKFIVKKSKRGGSTASNLMSATVRFGVQNAIMECFIDCIPQLVPYYKAVGFMVSGEKFLHRENGPSLPMRLDVQIHGEKLCQERRASEDLKIYVKAQAIRIWDRIRHGLK